MASKLSIIGIVFVLIVGCRPVHVSINSNKDSTYQDKIKRILIIIPPDSAIEPTILKSSFETKFRQSGVDANVIIMAPLELDERKIIRDASLKFRPTHIMDFVVKSIARTTYANPLGRPFHSANVIASEVTFEINIVDTRMRKGIWRSNVECGGSEYSLAGADELAGQIVQKLHADGLLMEPGSTNYSKSILSSQSTLSPPVIPDSMERTILTSENTHQFLMNILGEEDINYINRHADKFLKDTGNFTYTIKASKQRVLILLRKKNNKSMGCFFRISEMGYPVIPVSVLSEKIRPSKVDEVKMKEWFRRMSHDIATEGKSTSLIVLESGNSFEVELYIDTDNDKILHHSQRFMKKGTFESADYSNVLSGAKGYGVTITKYRGNEAIDIAPSIP